MDIRNRKLEKLISTMGLQLEISNEPKDIIEVISKGVWNDPERATELGNKMFAEIQTNFDRYGRFFMSTTNAEFQNELKEIESGGGGGVDVDAFLEAAAYVSEKVIVLIPLNQRITYFPQCLTIPNWEKVYIVEVQGKYRNAVSVAREHQVDVNSPDDFEKCVTAHLKDISSRAARSFLVVTLIINTSTVYATASDAFNKEKITEIRLVVSNIKSDMLKALKTDMQLVTAYTFYAHSFPFAYSGENDYKLWQGKILIPWLLATTLNIKWRGAKVVIMCSLAGNGKAHKLFQCYWETLALEVMQDLTDMQRKPDVLFCTDCTETCPYRQKAWHLNLRNFHHKVVSSEKAKQTFAWQRYSPFESSQASISTVLQKLRDLSKGACQAKNVIHQVSNLVQEMNKNVEYCSYLLLLLDGENMDKLKKLSPLELLNCSDVVAAVYAGMTEDGDLCENHFIDDTSYVKFVSRTTQIYFLRRQKFKTYPEAANDEALVITILKVLHNINFRSHTKQKLNVLNHRSENIIRMSESLFADMPESLLNAKEYILSGIPLIKTDPNDSRVFTKGNFRGNFTPVKYENMPYGPYQNRAFQDVKEKYEVLERKPFI